MVKTSINPKKKFDTSSFHTKLVDVMTIAEALNIKESVTAPEKSLVCKKISEIKEYSVENDMKLNLAKIYALQPYYSV